MTGPFRRNDIVGVDIKGRQFIALVTDIQGQQLSVTPLVKNVTYFTITSRDVVAIWRYSKGKHPAVNAAAGVNFS